MSDAIGKFVEHRLSASIAILKMNRTCRRALMHCIPLTRRDLLADLAAYAQRDPATGRDPWVAAETNGFGALLLHRLAHAAWLLADQSPTEQRRQLQRGAVALMNRAKNEYLVEIHPAARLTAPFVLDHAAHNLIGSGVRCGPAVYVLHDVVLAEGRFVRIPDPIGVIGQTVSAGPGSVVANTVVLGAKAIATNRQGCRHPILGSGVELGAGVRVLGAVRIGDRVRIGAGAWVMGDVGQDAVVEDGAHVYGTVRDGARIGAWALVPRDIEVLPGTEIHPGTGWGQGRLGPQ